MRKTLFCLSTLTLLALQQAAFAEAPKIADGRFVTADGMTLYTFDKDTTPGVSACTGGCMSNWPAAMASPSDKPSGDWTVIPSADGKQQWAYKGHPLYRYAADKQAGDMKGDGFKDMWHTAKP
ncbi:Predicted lipoprotein with conserved Yx(FWY)xxD motif [Burkholderia sp. GAS332]|jgi:predicted lipoprotein with Yx(FWY)xxD motif|uniref:COG4315 family predicted lipoprotein n=1 Tax=Paraburkholderia TaxID=1822464 RepID=UPI00092AA824|nr:Predicted lipoprotein with conserved Yx(FWY)xxD motif [Burkholderia sp. GAS332]